MDSAWSRDERDARGNGWRAALLVALAGFAVWRFAAEDGEGLLDPDALPRDVTPRGDLEAHERATIALFERASPAVVFIRNRAVELDAGFLIPTESREGTGSGFVWDEEGHVVTNYHVIHASQGLDVTFANHETYPARIVGYEVEKDLAVLQVDAPRRLFRPLDIGSSADLRVGQDVFAIGNPFGLDQTLTSGIISGLGREMPAKYEEYGRGQRVLTDLIQTQAPINPGNSGGPLLDSAGRLIGMNTAIVSPSGASAGIGFAIPVDTINRVTTEILRFGQASRPSLGVLIAKDYLSAVYGIPGVVVIGIVPGSGAESAGLRGERLPANGRLTSRHDVIIGVDGKPVRTSNDLFRILAHHSVGDRVQLEVLRDGAPRRFDVELKDLRPEVEAEPAVKDSRP